MATEKTDVVIAGVGAAGPLPRIIWDGEQYRG